MRTAPSLEAARNVFLDLSRLCGIARGAAALERRSDASTTTATTASTKIQHQKRVQVGRIDHNLGTSPACPATANIPHASAGGPH